MQGVETVDREDFARDTEGFRRELLAHCYRLLGSADEAEDLVQETYLRAWRAYDRFEGRSSMRTWLYRIATNACLTALQNRGRRALPAGLGAPSDDPSTSPVGAGPEVSWLQPLPDVLVSADADDPAAIVVSRDSLRLALIASLQYLPPRQRAVLLLRDVLAWSAAEVAEALDLSTAAVKSLLQRARTRLAEVSPDADTVVAGPASPAHRQLLDRYIAAFQNADAAALEELLTTEATIEMVGSTTWFAGKKTCVGYLATQVLGTPGTYRLLPIHVNGQLGVAGYQRRDDGAYAAFGIGVLDLTLDGIAAIRVFGDTGLVETCGLPLRLG